MQLAKCILLLLIVGGLTSCKREIIADVNVNQPISKKDWDKMSQLVAIDVADKLNNLQFRKMLKHEVMLRFDGDANILLSSIVKRLPKYFSHEAATKSAREQPTVQSKNQELLSKLDFRLFSEAAKAFPQMQIAVQTAVEKWDPVTFIPSVVFLPSSYDESNSTTVPGYDHKKQSITVDATKDPAINYVVISQNERTTIRNGEVRLTSSNCPVEPVMLSAPYNPNGPSTSLLPPDDCGGGGTGGGGTTGHPQYIGIGHDGVLPSLINSQMGTVVGSRPGGGFYTLAPVGTFNGTIVYRTNQRHEKMRAIRCNDVASIEGWPAGAPEIRLHVFEQNVQNPSENLQIFKEEFEPSRRSDISDAWWNTNGVTMHLWDYQGTGTKASFGYYEYDPVTVPNEAIVSIGELIVDILAIRETIPTGTDNQMTIYGNIRRSVATGIRALKKKNGMSEYIGKDDYSIFNNQDQFNHNPGGTQFKTSPDL